MSPERFVKGESERTLSVSLSWCRSLRKIDFAAQNPLVWHEPCPSISLGPDVAGPNWLCFSGDVSSGAVPRVDRTTIFSSPSPRN
jgi:hypothetical protein